MKNQNNVELIGYYGNDTIIACSAWTSTSREITEEKKARIPKLIAMLAKEGHHTPFEKGIVHFLVTTDIATHIHLLKHRIASINSESARYKELKEDKFFIPTDWPNKWKDELEAHTKRGNNLYHDCLKDLVDNHGFDRKRAKESARFFKGYNMQYQADVMLNWRSFMNFQKLRNSEHSQKEIREVAAQMLELVKNIEGQPFRHTLAAFGY